jgi:signal transduction histidine kinase
MKSATRLSSDINLSDILIDCSNDAIIAIDPCKTIIAWNTMAEFIYDRSRETVTDKPLLEIIPSMAEDKESFKAIERAFQGFKSFLPSSTLFPHREHVESHFIPLKTGNKIIGVMILVHDVSHRIIVEEQLKSLNSELQNRLRQLQVTTHEMTSFTNITSNNIKEPIRFIYTAVEHLIKSEAQHLSDSGKASFRRIQSSLNRMNLMLDDMLTLARIDILKEATELVDVEDVIRDFNDRHTEKIKETKTLITTGGICSIRAHMEQLFLLLHHLVDNAIKFNKSGAPKINITCKKVNAETDQNIKNNNWYYRLTVKDNGIGIAADDMDRAFRLFEKLNGNEYKGSGLGLAVVQKIMEAHAGFIHVDSNVGEGTSFKCYFPA